MNYLQMTAHSCRTTFQPCFDPAMLPKAESTDDGYVSQQINAMTVWQCLIDHGEMDAQAIAEVLNTTAHLVGLLISPMKKNGNVLTTRKKTRGLSTRYAATLKSPQPSPVYAVRATLKKNPGVTVAGLCALSYLQVDQVRSGIKQLVKENLVRIHCTYPKTYSLKGTA